MKDKGDIYELLSFYLPQQHFLSTALGAIVSFDFSLPLAFVEFIVFSEILWF